MKIYINGEERDTEKNSLKDILISDGYVFPCGGNGKCGRCKIKCAELPITERDKIFVGERERNDGVRLACDKTVFGGEKIECTLEKEEISQNKLTECSAIAVLNKKTAEISLFYDEIIETLTVDIKGQQSKELRSSVGRNIIKLLEKYSVAKADTVAVAGEKAQVERFLYSEGTICDGETDFDATELSMPSESVYALPIGKNGSAELCKRLFPTLSVTEAVAEALKSNRVKRRLQQAAEE